jgi:hypothetical protein
MERTVPLSLPLHLLIPVLGIVLSSGVQAQSNEVEEQVIRSIEAGNASELARHFTQKVDLTTPGTDDVFSKAQAEQILKDFFEEHDPKKLKLEHRGTSKLKDRYRIGKLVTSDGDFRLTYFMKKVNGEARIKKLRIENYEGDL